MTTDDGRGGVSGTPTRSVGDVGTFTALLENTELAETYLTALSSAPVTTPEIRAETGVSKKTAYAYVERLREAGLLREVESPESAAAYTAEPFRLTVEVAGTATEITPDLVRLLAQREDAAAVESVLDRHGVSTVADFLNLSRRHAEGAVTTREIAGELDISLGIVYDLLTVVYDTLNLDGAEDGHETLEPSDLDEF
ncbi:MAG: helix-turn-helix domain-containing protein, partial [Halobaculum sp.]